MGRLSKAGAALAAVAVLLAGGAYALASSSGGTITVCVSHNGGALYKAKKCAKHDTKLSWNKVGQQGPGGAPGANGAPGGSTWASVNSNGTVLFSAPSWGSNTVTHMGTGHYCTSQPVFWVTPIYTGADPVVANAAGGSNACPGGNLFLQDTKTGAPVDDAFLIFIVP
jgi:hypothetical protein